MGNIDGLVGYGMCLAAVGFGGGRGWARLGMDLVGDSFVGIGLGMSLVRDKFGWE